MKWLKEYWVMIVMAVSLISSTTAGQIQVAQNKLDIEKNSNLAFDSDAKIILSAREERDEIKEMAEKNHAENKKEIEKLKAKQEKQTILEVKMDYIQKDIKSNKESLEQILIEMRSKP